MNTLTGMGNQERGKQWLTLERSQHCTGAATSSPTVLTFLQDFFPCRGSTLLHKGYQLEINFSYFLKK